MELEMGWGWGRVIAITRTLPHPVVWTVPVTFENVMKLQLTSL
jgi:hypothetical protein